MRKAEFWIKWSFVILVLDTFGARMCNDGADKAPIGNKEGFFL